MSLVSMITNALTPSIADQISKQLGISSAQVQTGLKAIIPVILAAILGRSRKSDGATALSTQLAAQEPGLFDNLSNAVSRDAGALSAGGMSVLRNLLGGGTTDQLASKLGSFAGASGQGAQQLLGLGATAVIGALGKMSRDKGLDAAGLLKQLSAEQNEIAKAVPADFAKDLRGTGLLDSIPQNLAEARTSAAAIANEGSSGGRSWLPWAALAVAVIAAIAILPNLFSSDEPAEVTNVELTTAPPDVDTFTSALNDDLGTLSDTLGGITDRASAEAALPALQEIEGEISTLGSQFSALSEEAQSTVSGLVSAAMPQFTQTIESLLSENGIAEVVKPVFDGIMA
jgi:hypothetical protein